MSGANAASPRPYNQQGSDHRSHEPSMEEILASIRRIISDDQMLPLPPRSSSVPTPAAFGGDDPATSPGSSPNSGAADDAEAGSRADGAFASGRILPGVPPPLASAHGTPNRESLLREEEERRPDPAPIEDVPGLPAGDEHHITAPGDTAEGLSMRHEPLFEHPVEDGEAEKPSHDGGPIGGAPAARDHDGAAMSVGTHDSLISDQTKASVASSFHQLAANILMQNFPPVEDIARELLRPMLKTWLDDNLPVVVERLVRAEIERVARGVR